MGNYEYNYDQNYNEKLQNDINKFKTLRTIFIVVGVVLLVGGFISMIIHITNVFNQAMATASNNGSSYDEEVKNFAKMFKESAGIFLCSLLYMAGFTLIGVGSSVFTIKIRNRQRILNEGQITSHNDFDKDF